MHLEQHAVSFVELLQGPLGLRGVMDHGAKLVEAEGPLTDADALVSPEARGTRTTVSMKQQVSIAMSVMTLTARRRLFTLASCAADGSSRGARTSLLLATSRIDMAPASPVSRSVSLILPSCCGSCCAGA